MITQEHGKTTADARGEVARGLGNAEYACGLIEHLKGDFSSQVADGVAYYFSNEGCRATFLSKSSGVTTSPGT